MDTHWLYVFENIQLRSIYIGIGRSPERIFGRHNPDADSLRDAPGTEILQTIKPFSSREDALIAEALAIHVASFSGMQVFSTGEDGEPVEVTNRSGVRSSERLGPAILIVDGEEDIESYSGAVIVSISAEVMDSRKSPYGGTGGAAFSERAAKYWNIKTARRPRIQHLIATLKGSGGRVLGSWEVNPQLEWLRLKDSTEVTIPLVNPEADDYLGLKGKRLLGIRANSGVVYSPDIA